jgi:ParB-like chromosome segregation protein Spo0J
METVKPYQLLPPLTEDEYEALKGDIKERGVLVPIELDDIGNILDGHHRRQIAEELGLDCPTIIRTGLTEAQKRSHSRALNLHRRHLNRAQKRTLIAEELNENPTDPNLQIAVRLGVSDVTVGKIRRELGLTGEIKGADGKTYQSVRKDQLKETLEYTVAFSDRESYERFILAVKQAKKWRPEKLIADNLIDLIGAGLEAMLLEGG